MSKQTSMQELIQWLNPLYERTLAKATELLERERSIIENTFEAGKTYGFLRNEKPGKNILKTHSITNKYLKKYDTNSLYLPVFT